MTKRHLLIPALVYVVLSGCASVDEVIPVSVEEPVETSSLDKPATPASSTLLEQMDSAFEARSEAIISSAEPGSIDQARSSAPALLSIDSPRRTGTVENRMLDEASGLAVSTRMPGVLFAVNDGGNPARLYALSETGKNLGAWAVNARNHDWEDMGNLHWGGKDYLVIGDTGNNRRRDRESVLYLVEEPSLDTPADTVLEPVATIRFVYEDGPRNVEAFAFSGRTLYLVSKEPIGPDGPAASRLYELQIPEYLDDSLLVARHTGSLPLAATNLESRLAAALASVDLNHPTALDFDANGKTAYLLTYRHVLEINRSDEQTWAEAFSQPAERLYAHDLKQAEALSVMPGQSIWFTSEFPSAPLWALPIPAPS